MFSWICPKCGAEVPPSENDCPRCAKVHAIPVPPAQPAAAPAPGQMPPQPPLQQTQQPPIFEQQPPQMVYPPQQPYGQQAGYAPQPGYAQPPDYAQQPQYPPMQTQQQPQFAPPPPLLTQTGPWQSSPAQQQPMTQQPPAPQMYQQPQYAPPPVAPPTPTYMMEAPKSGLPGWLVVLIVAGALIGVGWAGIRFLSPSTGSEETAAKKEPATKEESKKAAATGAGAYAKYVELTGLRVVENAKKKLEVQMVAVNHSAAELPDLKLRVILRVANAPAGKEPISTFTVNVPSLGAFEVRDLKTEAVTKLRAYEFPDWQFLKVDFDPVSQ